MEKESINVAAALKRGNQSCWPQDVDVEDDPSKSGFDERLENPIIEERVRNLILVGQVQAIALQLVDDGSPDGKVLIADGRQRWKAATLINHLAGVHLYTGKVKAIKNAIAQFKGSELEALAADRCSKGIRLLWTRFTGDERRASRATASANEQRDDDPIATKIRRVQRMVNVLNHPPEDVAEDMGVSIQTIKRWLKRDPDEKRTRRAPSAKRKPGKTKLVAVFNQLNAGQAKTLLGWVLGEYAKKDLLEAFPAIAADLQSAVK